MCREVRCQEHLHNSNHIAVRHVLSVARFVLKHENRRRLQSYIFFVSARERERLWVAALASCRPYYKKKWKVKFRMTQSLYKSFALGTKHKHQKFSFRMKVEAGMMQAFSAASWPTVTSFINCHVTFILMLVSFFFYLYSVQHGCTNKFRGTYYRY